jgi:hypothetical protein
MNDEPHAADLLATARAAFNDEILPALPQEQRYTALMIANALAIVQRELEAGDAPARAEHERLARLLAEPAAAPAGAALHAALEGYNRRLANDIRAGRFDGTQRAAMLEHLRQTTAEKLAVSNPKALTPAPPPPLPEGEGGRRS